MLMLIHLPKSILGKPSGFHDYAILGSDEDAEKLHQHARTVPLVSSLFLFTQYDSLKSILNL
jgi:hypothetical protein